MLRSTTVVHTLTTTKRTVNFDRRSTEPTRVGELCWKLSIRPAGVELTEAPSLTLSSQLRNLPFANLDAAKNLRIADCKGASPPPNGVYSAETDCSGNIKKTKLPSTQTRNSARCTEPILQPRPQPAIQNSPQESFHKLSEERTAVRAGE